MSKDNEHIHGLDEALAKLNEAIQYINNDIPVVCGVEAVNHFKESFVNEGFTDTSLTKWASRKTKRAGGTNTQPVLTKSGELADSIEFEVRGSTVIIKTDKKYAEIHNNGGTINVTDDMKKYFWAMHHMAKEANDDALASQWKGMALAKEIKIPKRQYIGESEALNNRIANKIVKDLTRILS